MKETFLLFLFFCPNKNLFQPSSGGIRESLIKNTLRFVFLSIRVQICALSWMTDFGYYTREDPLAS